MKTFGFLKLAASTLVLGAGFAATAGTAGEHRSDQNSNAMARAAASAAAAAHKALGENKAVKAVPLAERAVASMPRDASYRQLLGESYLASGRFISAEDAFSDALALGPGNERVALKLALVKIALGKRADARGLLDEHRAALSAADYGLAVALNGDADTGVAALEAAARMEGATPKTRQNLALTYALAGKWMEARAVAAQDLPGHLVDKRIVEWASFARPVTVWEQIAGLLGVTPSVDRGQPVALALAAPSVTVQLAAAAPQPAPVLAPVVEAPVAVAAIEPEPAFEIAPPIEVAAAVPPAPVEVAVVPAQPAPAPVEVAAAPAPAPAPEPVPVVEAQPAVVFASAPVAAPAPVFAPVAPVAESAAPVEFEDETIRLALAAMGPSSPVQVADAALIRADPVPVKQAVVAASDYTSDVRPVESGRFVVQLGAYASAARADAAWKQIARRNGKLEQYDARQSRITLRKGSFYRLAVSGFASRADAGRVCTQVRATGGACFVRNLTANETIRFAARKTDAGTQLAFRN